MDLKIDGSGDLVVENGDFVFVDGVDAIAQNITIALRLFKGEDLNAPDEGVPYFDRVFVKGASSAALTAVFRRSLLAVSGVTQVLRMEVSIDAATRTLALDFDVRVDTGEVLPFRKFIVNV